MKRWMWLGLAVVVVTAGAIWLLVGGGGPRGEPSRDQVGAGGTRAPAPARAPVEGAVAPATAQMGRQPALASPAGAGAPAALAGADPAGGGGGAAAQDAPLLAPEGKPAPTRPPIRQLDLDTMRRLRNRPAGDPTNPGQAPGSK